VSGDGRRVQEGRIGAYRGATRALAVLTIVLGGAMVVFTARHGGGVGLVLGALFVFAGAGRLYLLRRDRQ
jgi:hypothetical protein